MNRFGISFGLCCSFLLLGASAEEGDGKRTNFYENLLSKTRILVDAFYKEHPEKAVMVRTVSGPYTELVSRALDEALHARGIHKALRKDEAKQLRVHYRNAGIDPYRDPEFQRLLKASHEARLSLDAQTVCDPGQTSCTLWIRALMPNMAVFSQHQTFQPPGPKPRTRAKKAPQSRAGLAWVLGFYALVPALLHRFDMYSRTPQGTLRKKALWPVTVLGNRTMSFVLLLSFMLTVPRHFERHVFELSHEPQNEVLGFGVSYAAMLTLHFFGCLLVALWQDSRRRHGYFETWKELFVLHPNYWTKKIEGRYPGDGVS